MLNWIKSELNISPKKVIRIDENEAKTKKQVRCEKINFKI